MTRPDVAVLATALREVGLLPEDNAHEFCDEDSGGNHHFDTEAWAEAIIAALAAQGWRITFDFSEDHGKASVDADLRLSAQAAPDITLDREWFELEADALASDGPIRDSDVKDAIKRHRRRIEQAAVRAALEGLRAEVAADDEPYLSAEWLLDLIDARLADLDG